MRRNIAVGMLAGAAAVGALANRASAYIEAQYSLGKIVADCTNIVLVKVESVDRQNNIITYRKVEDIKGKHEGDVIKENIAHAGFNPREWQIVMAWAAEGKLAVFCNNDSGSETCIDNYWFQCYARRGSTPAGEWWDMYHGEPFLLRSFAGKPAIMAAAIKAMLQGEQVVIPCMVDGDKNALAIRTARIQRMRASMKLQDYNAARDFAGWGGEQIQPVLDMAGFERIGRLPVMGGQSGWGVATGHLEGEERTDLVLYSENRVAVMSNAGEGSFDEVDLPGGWGKVSVGGGGARAAAMADYNGTGRGSVLLATPAGPRLLTGLAGGKLRDDSSALPKRAYWGLTGAAWINIGDKGRPAILLADEYGGLRVFKNMSAGPVKGAGTTVSSTEDPVVAELAMEAVVPGAAKFEDISDAAGLGEHGLCAGMNVVELLTADLDGDGLPKVIVNGTDGRGVVLGVKDGKFFEESGGALRWAPGSRLAIGDVDGDGKIDVMAISPGGMRVWKNLGGGQFADVTRESGLSGVMGTSAAMVPRFGGGKTTMDLFIGCLGQSNRYFQNDGHGAFTEMTEQIGLGRRIFNSRALAVLPAAKGREASADLVMVNEGQASEVLVWKR